MDTARLARLAFSLSVDSGVRVFIVYCGSIGALQAVIVVLQVATIETIMSDIEIRFAGSEGLEGRNRENVKLGGDRARFRPSFLPDVVFLHRTGAWRSMILFAYWKETTAFKKRCLPLADTAR